MHFNRGTNVGDMPPFVELGSRESVSETQTGIKRITYWAVKCSTNGDAKAHIRAVYTGASSCDFSHPEACD